MRIIDASFLAQTTRLQTGDLECGFVPGMGFGLGCGVVKEPQGVTERLSKGSFGHGGAFGTQGWMDPTKDFFAVLLIQRLGLPMPMPRRCAGNCKPWRRMRSASEAPCRNCPTLSYIWKLCGRGSRARNWSAFACSARSSCGASNRPSARFTGRASSGCGGSASGSYWLEGDLFLVLHLMIAGRLHWKPAGAKPPGKIGLAAFDFPHRDADAYGGRHQAAGLAAPGSRRGGTGPARPGGLEVLDAT